MQTTLDKIKSTVEEAKKFPNPTIEYNFGASEIEKLSGIDHDSFYGVKAIFNPKVPQGTCHVIYKLS